ncbi:MAG: hypothetical protein ACPG4U_03305 [Pseudomonadales bacterium]
MTDQEFTAKLKLLTLEQLTRIQEELPKLVLRKKERMQQKLQQQVAQKQRSLKTTSANLSKDVSKMADDLGLDLSGLMRDIARR